ncbi:MAG: ABC transporter permease [Chloroflexota bacterium]|nr:ABC transporter permease [Chloroflexota bacterium]
MMQARTPAAAATGSSGASEQTLGSAAPVRQSARTGAFTALRRQRLAMTGALIVAFFAIVAIVGPAVAPHGPTEQFTWDRLQAPSLRYPFGIDEFGRDIFSRLLYGARISFQVGAIAVGIAGTLGVVLGMVAGYAGGWVDNVLTLLMDVVFAFPAILLAIAIVTMRGNSLANVMIAIAVVYAPTFMRVVRGAVLGVRRTAYVEAAVAVGAPVPRILARHVFPNITAPLIVHASLNFAFAVLAEAALAFLGLGNKPPSPSWGSMVSSSYGFLQLAPWAAIVPGTAIALAVLGFNLLGDGLRDALDPRLRS